MAEHFCPVDHLHARLPRAIRSAPVGLTALAFLLLMLGLSSSAIAQTGDAERLPEVMPEATRVGAMAGEPPAAPAYRDDELLGYVFHTREVVASVGYSGKPLDVLVGLGLDGRITGAAILEQHEPILIIGVSPADLEAFVDQYRGLDIRAPIEVARTGRGEHRVDAVSGATISSTVINDGIVRAARAVARARGLFGRASVDLTSFEPLAWQALLDDGSLQRLALTVAEIRAALAERTRDCIQNRPARRPTPPSARSTSRSPPPPASAAISWATSCTTAPSPSSPRAIS